MAEVLRCADQWGREIILYEDTWYDKIVAQHPPMDGQLDGVEEAIIRPDRVNYDAEHATGENYYRFGVLPYPFSTFYLKVVVRFETNQGALMGTVITAYPSREYGRSGERVKWHRRGHR